MRVTFESEALEEYREAAQYSEDHFGLGGQFVQAVQDALAQVSSNPVMFHVVGLGIKIFRMRRFPYHLFFHHDEDHGTITVYAVAHHKRRPDYWRERISG